MKIESNMTPRLLAVANAASDAQIIADIGTDHAYVPVYLVQNNMINRAIAMDINEGPLFRASENIKKFSLESRISTRLSDGLSALSDNEADTVIIAGMGGVLINSIIRRDKDRLTSVKRYVLQPMTAIDETRRYLEQNGFVITDETLAKEDEKIYTIITAQKGEMKICREVYYHIGEMLVKKRDKILPELLQGKIYEYEKALSSMQNTQNLQTKEKALKFELLLGEFKELYEECKKW